MNSRFIYIILAIVLVLLVNPFIESLAICGHLLSSLLVAMIPLASVYALIGERRRVIAIFSLAAPFVLPERLSFFYTSRLYSRRQRLKTAW